MKRYAKLDRCIYSAKNPSKYIGKKDPSKLKFRSTWELHVHKYCDTNPNIIEWSSEEINIKYLNPLDNKIHKYYPDYYIKYKQKGKIIQEIVEVKPYKQTIPSKAKKSKNKNYENLVYAKNIAKWESAMRWCKKRGLRFRILTEKDIFTS